MFYNTSTGLQLETENGWTVSISLSGERMKEECEIAVWPTGLGDQKNWIRWGCSSIEPPDFPICDRVVRISTTGELLQTINTLSNMPKEDVQPNKWIHKGMSIWR
tara:strand:- start:93 stop:407 length:315 start_codon:yes stop_codon:yes gene_type:complete